eukprot:TRINITY_DN596_c0_g3_i1.p1 TRINITY_DN596_c0_g3~~TRINITY_DN596_c0_g3_i1.p1  ORF type:complete len:321 (+),score=35.20 TRINITY_DN596_c0_g3_i1:352-1314(+)
MLCGRLFSNIKNYLLFIITELQPVERQSGECKKMDLNTPEQTAIEMNAPLLRDEFDEMVAGMKPTFSRADDNLPEVGIPFYYYIVGWLLLLLTFPLTVCSRIVEVPPNNALLVTLAGRVWWITKEPGTHFISIPGAKSFMLSLQQQAINLKVTCCDSNGCTVDVAAAAVVVITDPLRYSYNHAYSPIYAYGKIVLKKVVSQFSFASTDTQTGLTHNKIVSEILKQDFQDACDSTGIEVLSFEISEISYGQEIASQMLKCQQAQATVEARKLIVEGAVGMISDTVDALKEKNVYMCNSEASRVARRLLCLVTSEKGTSRVL